MLTVFRNVLPGGSGPAGASVAVSVGTLEVEFVWPLALGRRGNAEDETARCAVAGDGRNEDDGTRDAELAVDGRDLATGKEGRGPVGGAIEGRDGRGSVVVMVKWLRLENRCGVVDCWERVVDLRP
jgi:hypothetical protein